MNKGGNIIVDFMFMQTEIDFTLLSMLSKDVSLTEADRKWIEKTKVDLKKIQKNLKIAKRVLDTVGAVKDEMYC